MLARRPQQNRDDGVMGVVISQGDGVLTAATARRTDDNPHD